MSRRTAPPPAARPRVVAEVAKQITVRGTKYYRPPGLFERHKLTSEEQWLAIKQAMQRGTPAVHEPDALSLHEATAVQLAVLAALDGTKADIGKATLRELQRARLKLDQLILFQSRG
jgi:hypothetical protein